MAHHTFFEWFTQYLMWIPITFMMLVPYIKNQTGKCTVGNVLLLGLISVVPFCNMVLSCLLLFAWGEILGKRFIKRYAYILDKEIL